MHFFSVPTTGITISTGTWNMNVEKKMLLCVQSAVESFPTNKTVSITSKGNTRLSAKLWRPMWLQDWSSSQEVEILAPPYLLLGVNQPILQRRILWRLPPSIVNSMFQPSYTCVIITIHENIEWYKMGINQIFLCHYFFKFYFLECERKYQCYNYLW